MVKNDYFIVMITTQNGGTISSVKDTLENTFTSVISNTNTELAAIYIAKNTNKSAADTITVAFGGAQSNVTVGISEMAQINSVTATVTGSGHGSATPSVELSSSIQPNLGDACFATGIAASSANTNIVIPTAPAITNNYIDSGFGMLFLARSSGTAGISFGTFLNDPNATEPIRAQVISLNPTNSAHPNLGLWEEVAACFPQNQVTTTTTTTTTTTNTTTTKTNTTTTFTSTTTSTQNVTPEPSGSIDFLLILLAIIIYCIMIGIGLKVSGLYAPLLTMVGALTLAFLEIGMLNNRTIVYGQNSLQEPQWLIFVIGLFVLVGFILFIIQVGKIRR